MRIKLVVMQATSLCNLNCTYCYVPDRHNKYKMPDEVLEATFGKVLASSLIGQSIEFLWHAGEPLAAGLEFYKKAVGLSHEHNQRKIEVRHTIQTNGTLLNKKWCDFLVRNDFSVGISIDGPEQIHDRVRRTWGGRGSFHSALRGYELLREAGIRPGLLCVLTANSLLHPEAMYDFFLELEISSLAFNIEEVEGANRNASTRLEACPDIRERYASFLATFFRRWISDNQPFRVREFDDFLSLVPSILTDDIFVRQPDEVLPLAILTVHRNGNISPYSPEFAGVSSERYHDFVLGNITNIDIDNLLENDRFVTIRHEVENGIRNCAGTCHWFPLCGGAYLSNKYCENGALDSAETTACRLHRQTLAQTMITEISTLQRMWPSHH